VEDDRDVSPSIAAVGSILEIFSGGAVGTSTSIRLTSLGTLARLRANRTLLSRELGEPG